MGGEAVVVKNLLNAGEDSEIVVEDVLLEHGISKHERRRYMKMACGENPRRVYSHTRMGNAVSTSLTHLSFSLHMFGLNQV